MIILEDIEKNLYDEQMEDSYFFDKEEYEYDEFGGWFKKIRKKITPKRVVKGLFMPHKLIFMPHNFIKKKILSKTPIGKITKGIENTMLSTIGLKKSKHRRYRPRTLVRPARPIRRGYQPNQRGAVTPKVIAGNHSKLNRQVGANQLLNQSPTKGVKEQVKVESKPKQAGISNGTIAIAVGVLLVGGYLAFGRKAAVAAAPAPAAPKV
jgi:hypothetical protein